MKVLWDETYSFSPLSEKTRQSNHLQMSLQRQHFLLSYLKALSVGRAWVWTRELLGLSRPVLSQLSQRVRRSFVSWPALIHEVEGFVSSCFASPVSMIIARGVCILWAFPTYIATFFSLSSEKSLMELRLKCPRLKSCHMLANDPVGRGSKCFSFVFFIFNFLLGKWSSRKICNKRNREKKKYWETNIWLRSS